MKQFDIPLHYRSPIISKVKAKRKLDDPRKKDFSPTVLDFGNVEIIISRHFGFCYGVENAIEKSYQALNTHPDKNIYLLSQMIHNPDVNEDLTSQGIRFIQDTDGSQLIPWDQIHAEDIVIIPAFGTTIETQAILEEKGIDVQTFNTTCPFVEKVWNRSAKLGEDDYTIVIHGKHNHEETKATFSHSKAGAPSLIVKNMSEATFLGEFILGQKNLQEFVEFFKGKLSENFNPELHLSKIGVVNQTTMLATETQEIADYLKDIMLKKFGEADLKNHFADTRDTLCYATNDNQSSTIALLEEEADLAVVVGGYNSSNTTHLVELLEDKFKTYFVRNESEILSPNEIRSFNIHSKSLEVYKPFLPQEDKIRVIITSGASCPDAAVDAVIQKILNFSGSEKTIDDIVF